MLAFLVGLPAAVGPLLRGGWDLWAQCLVFFCLAGGLGLWLAVRVGVGYVPLPEPRAAAWAGMLALLSALSWRLSPVAAASAASWRWLIIGLFLFPAVTVLSKDERGRIDDALRACAWILVALAFYQRCHERIDRPFSALLNANVFAGAVLMLLPLAWQKKDWLLTAGLLVCLVWSHSVGAWLGLSGALILSRRRAGTAGYWAGAVIGFFCAVAIYVKLQSPDVFHRWEWWSAAARMSLRRPWLGYGPGSYAFVMPSFQREGADLSSLYAHQHFLETAAECGWPYLLLWAGGLLHLLRRGGSHKRFAVLAVLIQSLWDYPLSIPANFWLFCYLAASALPQASRGLNVRMRHKPAAALAVLALAALACRWSWRDWKADQLKAEAMERFSAGAPAQEARGLLERSSRLCDEPDTERFLAEVDLKELRAVPDVALARDAARHLEASAGLNPYRVTTWAALERLYVQLGEPERAAAAQAAALAHAPQSALGGAGR